MASKAVTLLAKPQMRGLLTAQIKKHLIVASALSVATMLAYKYAVAEPRKAVYAEFYRYISRSNHHEYFLNSIDHCRNYDVEKEYGRMREAGIFTAVRPSDE